MTHCRIRPHELEWNIVKTDLYALRGIPQPGPTEHMQKLSFPAIIKHALQSSTQHMGHHYRPPSLRTVPEAPCEGGDPCTLKSICWLKMCANTQSSVFQPSIFTMNKRQGAPPR